MLSTGKKWLFRALALALPFLLLFLVEGGLRLATDDPYGPIVEEIRADSVDWYQLNPSWPRRFFNVDTTLAPEFKPVVFRRQKSENAFRVICLGASSMFGTPYEMIANIPGIVRKQLRHLYPEVDVEVINFTTSAINSHVVLPIAREVPRFEPDLVLLYMGHNEFYGPEGVGATPAEKRFPALTRIKHLMRRSRLYQTLTRWLAPEAGVKQQGDEENLMRQVSKGRSVRLDSEDAQRVFDNYEANLGELLDVLARAEIPVIVSDVASNLRFAPFVYDTRVGDQDVGEDLEQARKEMAAGNHQQVIALVEPVLALDPDHPLANFLLAECRFAAGEYETAAGLFLRAKENDQLKFRAPERINRIIREQCAARDVELVSATQAFADRAEGGIAGFESFLEHLHPNLQGYYQIADLFLERLITAGLAPAGAAEAAFEQRLPCEPDRLSISWVELLFADLCMGNIAGKWPFEHLRYEPEMAKRAPQQLKRILGGIYQHKLSWNQACFEAGDHFEQKGELDRARSCYEAVLEEYPYHATAHNLLGRLELMAGRPELAIEHFEQSIRSDPFDYHSRTDLALYRVNSGDNEEAVRLLVEALDRAALADPSLRAAIHYGLAAAHANLGNLDEAQRQIGQSLRIAPGNPDAEKLRDEIERLRSR